MYRYPQRAIQLLLDGYEAAPSSYLRARSIATAKDLFARYTAILRPGEIDDAPATIPEYPSEGFEPLFPFALHQPRPGEPSLAAPISTGDEDSDWAASEDYMKRREAFAVWASRQPDRSLLMLDDSQRFHWLSAIRIKPETFFDWWRQRKFEAKLLQRDGHENLLETYWAGNRELRVTAPQRYVQHRILTK